MIMNMNMNKNNTNLSHLQDGFIMSSSTSMSLSQSFDALLQEQSRDLDLYLHFQGEKLRQVLHQQRIQELSFLVTSFEAKATSLLRQKEETLEKLRTKAMILENYLKKTEQETEEWQMIAKEKEGIAIGLSQMLENIKANLCLIPTNCEVNEGIDDVESVCDCENRGDAGHKRDVIRVLDCKLCNFSCSCVVFLPCMHLCCCKNCDALLSLCPVCCCVKEGSIEILL